MFVLHREDSCPSCPSCDLTSWEPSEVLFSRRSLCFQRIWPPIISLSESVSSPCRLFSFCSLWALVQFEDDVWNVEVMAAVQQLPSSQTAARRRRAERAETVWRLTAAAQNRLKLLVSVRNRPDQRSVQGTRNRVSGVKWKKLEDVKSVCHRVKLTFYSFS